METQKGRMNMETNVYYLSGKYSGKHWWNRLVNIYRAWKITAIFWEGGFTVICPHLNTVFFEYKTKLSHTEYLKHDLEILSLCRGIIMMKGLENSVGARQEYEFAKLNGLKIFYV